MKNKTDNIDKSYLCTIIYCIFAILKWAFFALCIVSAAFTLGFLVMIIFRGDLINNTMIAKMYSWLTFTSESNALDLVTKCGVFNVGFTAIIYGVVATITNGILYNMFNKFIDILISIITGNMYTKDNIEILQKLFPSTFVLAFFKPIMIIILADTLGVLSTSSIRLSGLTYVFVVFLLKVIFEKGYELEKKNIKISTEISDYKAREAEIKMEELSKDETIRQLKKAVKSLETKEEKKVVKKATVKKTVEAPKIETVEKKVKKTTTKKEAPKKTTVKKETAPKTTTTAKKATTTKKTSTKKTTK